MTRADPFAVLETEAPELPEKEVLSIVREHYGLEARLAPLLGERDQNVLLRCEDDRRFVLKIANSAENPLTTEFQIQALLHLESYLASHDCPINVPRIFRTLDGQASFSIDSSRGRHIVRVVTFLAGKPLGTRPASPELCRRLGVYLAHLGRALRDFDHPGSELPMLWDMQQAPSLRRILGHVADRDLRRAVAATLNDFESRALPQFGAVRSQVIHGDLNPDNVLTDPEDQSGVVGVIDFGDMSMAPLIVDVAVGASYLRVSEGNPLARIAEFLAGYHSVTRLELAEVDMLFDLIKTRLAASICILCWRAMLRGADDPYLSGATGSGPSAAQFLQRILELPRDHARQVFRQICAAATAAQPT